MYNLKYKKAFTLIELLVVISIIGIISGVVFVSLNPKDKINEANDAKKKQNLVSLASEARFIFSKNFKYSQDGKTVCDLVDSKKYDHCVSSEEMWVADSVLSDGVVWCMDSTGYSGEAGVSYSPGISNSCSYETDENYIGLANNDYIVNASWGVSKTKNVYENDASCENGATRTFSQRDASYNTTVNSFYNGVLNITLDSGEEGTFEYNLLCDGEIKDTATVYISREIINVYANDDYINAVFLNQPTSASISSNDSYCHLNKTRTYQITNNDSNITINSFNNATGSIEVVLTSGNSGVINYELLCNGESIDTAQIFVNGGLETVQARNDELAGVTVGEADWIDIKVNDDSCFGETRSFQQVSQDSNININSFNTSNGVISAELTSGVSGSINYELLCNGVVMDSAIITLTAGTGGHLAIASDDYLGGVLLNQNRLVYAYSNDSLCSDGTGRTFVITNNDSNITVNSFTNGVLNASLNSGTSGTVTYNLLCNGVIADSATITLAGGAGTATANDDYVTNAILNQNKTVNYSLNDTVCTVGNRTYQLGSYDNNININSFSTSGSLNFKLLSGTGGIINYNLFCGSDQVDSAKITISGGSGLAIANNDYITGANLGENIGIYIRSNDTECSLGSRSYQISSHSDNITIHSFQNWGRIYASLDSETSGTIDYDLLCSGNIADSAKVYMAI